MMVFSNATRTPTEKNDIPDIVNRWKTRNEEEMTIGPRNVFSFQNLRLSLITMIFFRRYQHVDYEEEEYQSSREIDETSLLKSNPRKTYLHTGLAFVKNYQEVKLEHLIVQIETGSRPRGGAKSTDGIHSIGAEHINKEGGFSWKRPKYIYQSNYLIIKKGDR